MSAAPHFAGSDGTLRATRGLKLPADASCNTCRHLLTEPQFWTERTLGEHRDAIQYGCRMCKLLVASIDTALPAAARLDSARVWLDQERNTFDECTSGVVVVMLEPSDAHGDRIFLKIFRVSETESLDLPIGISNRISQVPTDGDTLNKAVRWIESCQQSHTSCSKIRSVMPDRLVDAGTSVHNKIVKICSNLSQLEPYIALSHCWGNPALHTIPLKLLSSNISAYQQSVPWHLLSQTFKDAILFCQMLGIRYIWIDSLCIVQDDEQDWEQQASKMAAIYQSAWVTLAASAANSGAEGLFRPRFGSLCVLPGLYVRRFIDHRAWEPVSLASGGSTDNEDLPALRRAWCMQERLLSPRILHFTMDELVFECCDSTICECGDFTKQLDARSGRLAWKSEFHRSRDWYPLLVRYTSCGITKARDWLPALAGIASTFSNSGVTYIAGLWSDELLYGLSWQHRDPVPCDQRDSVPSFSWVHAPGPIHYESVPAGRSALLQHASVSDILWQKNATNPYIGFDGAYVHLKAMLIPVECYTSSILNNVQYDPFLRFKVPLMGEPSEEQCDGMVYPDVVEGLVEGSKVYWAPLWSFPSDLGHVVGLLLTTNGSGDFTRRGLGFHGFSHKFRDGEKQRLLSLCPQVELKLV